MRRTLAALAGASVCAAASRRIVRGAGWQRTNFAGSPVSLTGGLDVAGAILGACAAGASRKDIPVLVAAASAGAAGFIDDHLENRFPAQAKGFRGHLSALGKGQLTSGAVKIVIVGMGAALSAALLDDGAASSHGWLKGMYRDPSVPHGASARLTNWALNSAVIALSANLINLLDLRPGRARKAAIALGIATKSPSTAAGVLPGMRADLAGETMLGDLGANALGAQLGVAAATNLPTPARVGLLAALVGLNGTSEHVSFSRIIENTPVLRAIDSLGRSTGR